MQGENVFMRLSIAVKQVQHIWEKEVKRKKSSFTRLMKRFGINTIPSAYFDQGVSTFFQLPVRVNSCIKIQ